MTNQLFAEVACIAQSRVYLVLRWRNRGHLMRRFLWILIVWTAFVLAYFAVEGDLLTVGDLLRINALLLPLWASAIYFADLEGRSSTVLQSSVGLLLRRVVFASVLVVSLLLALDGFVHVSGGIHFWGESEGSIDHWYDLFLGIRAFGYVMIIAALLAAVTATLTREARRIGLFALLVVSVTSISAAKVLYDWLYVINAFGFSLFPYFWKSSPDYSLSEQLGQKLAFLILAVGPILYAAIGLRLGRVIRLSTKSA